MIFPGKTSLMAGAAVAALLATPLAAQSTDGNVLEETEAAVSETAEAVQDTATEMQTEMAETTQEAMPDAAPAEPIDLATAKVADLVGARVFGAEGDSVGKIGSVAQVADKTVAVIGVGGFLGIGRHNVAVEVDKLIPVDHVSLRLETLGRDDLKAMPEYDAAAATPLEDEAPVMPQN